MRSSGAIEKVLSATVAASFISATEPVFVVIRAEEPTTSEAVRKEDKGSCIFSTTSKQQDEKNENGNDRGANVCASVNPVRKVLLALVWCCHVDKDNRHL
jgi:hypothetical protein